MKYLSASYHNFKNKHLDTSCCFSLTLISCTFYPNTSIQPSRNHATRVQRENYCFLLLIFTHYHNCVLYTVQYHDTLNIHNVQSLRSIQYTIRTQRRKCLFIGETYLLRKNQWSIWIIEGSICRSFLWLNLCSPIKGYFSKSQFQCL